MKLNKSRYFQKQKYPNWKNSKISHSFNGYLNLIEVLPVQKFSVDLTENTLHATISFLSIGNFERLDVCTPSDKMNYFTCIEMKDVSSKAKQSTAISSKLFVLLPEKRNPNTPISHLV